MRAGERKRRAIPAGQVENYLAEIGDEIKKALEIVAASRMDDVLKVALLRMPAPISIAEDAAATVAAEAKDEPRATAH